MTYPKNEIQIVSLSNRKTFSFLFLFLFSLFFPSQALATWSIIAVDRSTGEIGIVGASCTFDVSGIASLVPGKGAIVVQAQSNYFARMKGVQLMNHGASTDEILTAMRHKDFDPENQQYGVVLLDTDMAPLCYSGSQIADWSGQLIGDDFAVMGNILVGPEVLQSAFDAFNEHRDISLSERLMLALKAGEQAGGDKRCGDQYARSAFISIYNPDKDAISKLSISGIDKGGQPAVTLLAEAHAKWK
ncbi:MAG: DUF1028 domain-containing protein [Bacteroidota bacterium]